MNPWIFYGVFVGLVFLFIGIPTFVRWWLKRKAKKAQEQKEWDDSVRRADKLYPYARKYVSSSEAKRRKVQKEDAHESSTPAAIPLVLPDLSPSSSYADPAPAIVGGGGSFDGGGASASWDSGSSSSSSDSSSCSVSDSSSSSFSDSGSSCSVGSSDS